MALRILIVDDAAFVRDTIKRALRRFLQDVEIFDANNGHRAIAALKANKVHLILSDWEMPEMSGEELLKWVREQEKTQKTPFVMISSRGDREHIMAAIQAGVNDYMTKPFTPDELQKKVMKQLNRIGYKPKRAGTDYAASADSVSVLTGGGGAKKAPQKPTEVKAAAGFGSPLTAKPAAKAAPKSAKAAPKKGNFNGRAQLRFPNATCQCEIRELSLQAMNGIMERPDTMPAVFEQAVVDMENAKGEAIARLNAYIHSMSALDPRPDCEKLKVVVRFVDNDPDKFEVLSKAVAGG